MAGKKQKYYVVWYGREPGIYTSWEECVKQTSGFKGAKYKAYPSREEAEQAFICGPDGEQRPGNTTENKAAALPGKAATPAREKTKKTQPALPSGVMEEAVAVDAACSGNPGKMEYRGVYLKTGRLLFHYGPCYGTNNIGEFLAIVHALALIKKTGANVAVYSDSRNAILWVKQKKCKTTLPRNEKTEELFKIICRAEKWLRENNYDTPILKWETSRWGEIPADFGRKK